MKSIFKCTLFIILFVLTNNIIGQKKVIDIWNGSIPGSIKNNAYYEDTIKLDDGKCRIRRVVNPTLTIFTAPAETATGAAVIICPGGGYTRLAIDNEGEGVVRWLNKAGITAAILKYRLPNDTIMKDKSVAPLQDLQQAVRVLRKNAKDFYVNGNKIGVIGFSAGGHLAATLATRFDDIIYETEKISARPDFTILVYPVISMRPDITHKGSSDCLLGKNPSKELIEKFSNELNVGKNTPPAFLVHAQDDKSVPVQNSIEYFTALKKYDIPAELHVFTVGGHGFGLAAGRKTTVSQWPDECLKWLKEMILDK